MSYIRFRDLPPDAAPPSVERRGRPLPRIHNSSTLSICKKPPKPLPKEVEYKEYGSQIAPPLPLDKLIEKDFCDLTIRCGDGSIYRCHKVLLASVSPYMHERLQKMKSDQPLSLPDVNSGSFEYILRYIYSVEIWITLEDVLSLTQASEKLGIHFLHDKCLTFLERNFGKFWKSDQLIEVPVRYMKKILTSSQLFVSSEDDLFKAIKKWYDHDKTSRLEHTENLIKCLYLESCSLEFLYTEVCESEIMQSVACLKLLIKVLFHLQMTQSNPDLIGKKSPRIYQECGTEELLVIKPEEETNAQFNRLRYNKHYTDVVIKASNGAVHCHKYILCAGSPYYKAMFRSGMREATENEVSFEEIMEKPLNCLIEYIYIRKYTPTKDTIIDMLCYGHLLELHELVNECGRFMVSNIKSDTCLCYHRLSMLYNLTELETATKRFLYGKFETILDTDDFLELTPHDLISLIRDERITVNNEEKLYESVVKWLDYDNETRSPYMDEILKFLKTDSLEVAAEDRNTGSEKISTVERKKKSKLITKDRPLTVIERKKYHKGLYQDHMIVPTCINGTCLYYVSGKEHWASYNMEEERQVCNMESTYGSHKDKFVQMGGGVGLDEQWWMIKNLNEHWIHMPEITSPLRYYTCSIDDNWLFVIGGWSNTVHQNTMHAYSFEKKKWTKMKPMLFAVSNPIVIHFDDKIYVLGGYNGSFQDKVQIYSLLIGKWTEGPKMPKALSRREAGGIVFDNKIMLFGETFCLCYDPVKKTWTKQTYPQMHRISAPILWQEQIVVHSMVAKSATLFSEKTIRFYSYNPDSCTWKYMTTIPDIRGYNTHGTCVSNRLFVTNMSVI